VIDAVPDDAHDIHGAAFKGRPRHALGQGGAASTRCCRLF
jgi:hypothetical protein